MFLTGQLLDQDCVAIAGAQIDFLHANPDGSYDLSSSEMRYYGRVTTDKNGWYELDTLVPGHYLNGDNYRPAHIHVKVWVDGVAVLTTQLYFAGDKFNDIDTWADGLVGSFTFTV